MYRATVNFSNNLNDVIEQVYLYIAFADDGSTPDYGSIEVYDITNGATLDDDDFDASSKGIHMGLLSMTAGETRRFRITYYVEEENIQPSEAIVVLDDFGDMAQHEGENYYYLLAQYINKGSETFIGPIHIQFNFTLPQVISPESLDVWDDTNLRWLIRDDYAYTSSGITISQGVVGRVSPQSARTYEIYYLYAGEPEDTMKVVNDFLSSPVGVSLLGFELLGVHLVVAGFLAFGVGSYLGSDERKPWKERSWILWFCLILAFLVVMAWAGTA